MEENWIRNIPEPRCLLLAWQAPDQLGNRSRWAVGKITPLENDVLKLHYFQLGAEFSKYNGGRDYSEIQALGYQGYLTFDVKKPDHTAGVAAALNRRLPPSTRSDFSDYMRQFRLKPAKELTLFAILGRTEAKLPSDGFSVVDPLNPDDLNCDLMLEVAGFRYAMRENAIELEIGQPLELRLEPDNQRDPNAVMICAAGSKIGYINRLQAPTFKSWMKNRRTDISLERLNGSQENPRAFVFVKVRPLGE